MAHPTVSLGQSGVLQAVALSGAFLALFALLGLGLGTVMRHTAGAIAVFAGFTLLGPSSSTPSRRASPVTPRAHLRQLGGGRRAAGRALSVTIGVVVMLIYCAVALGLGALLLNRRDA